MRKIIKKISAIIIAVFLIVSYNVIIGHATDVQPMAMPVNFVNIYNSSLTFYISDGGIATLMYTVSGLADSGKIIVKTYIERKTLGVFWSKIDLGNGSTEWTDSSMSIYTSKTHSVKVSKTGTYRATMVIYVDGDSITKRAEFEYKGKDVTGDVNFDGKVTASDARLILRYTALLERFSSSQRERADMNADGRITASDARQALRKAANL